MDESVTVRTKEQLQAAYDAGKAEIVVEGELATHIRIGRKVGRAGRWALTALGVALAATRFTGRSFPSPLSTHSVASTTAGLAGRQARRGAAIAAITGLEIAVIVAVSFVGLSLLIAILKEYEYVEVSQEKVILRKGTG